MDDAKAAKVKPHYHGHRDRLRERFREQGATALPDYELLELLLYRSIPRRDTKPIAKELLAAFGSFTEVLSAPSERLKEFSGIGETVVTDLKLIEAAAQRFARDQVNEKEVLSSWEAVLSYCRASMAYADKEQFRILFLDKKNGLLADELQQTGTVDHTPVYPREVVKRALEHGASAIILVHNHPSGDPSPSRADIQLTKNIAEILRPLGISLHDHLIVGREGHTSFRQRKLF